MSLLCSLTLLFKLGLTQILYILGCSKFSRYRHSSIFAVNMGIENTTKSVDKRIDAAIDNLRRVTLGETHSVIRTLNETRVDLADLRSEMSERFRRLGQNDPSVQNNG